MALILRRGELPATPHTEFYAKTGVLALEEIHGCYGFSGAWSRKMHSRRYPTVQALPPARAAFDLKPKPATELPLQPFHIRTGRLPYRGDFLRGRKVLLYGASTTISVCKPTRSSPAGEFFRNGDGHEAFFVQEGNGDILTEYGKLAFRRGHYIIIPKGTTYRMELDTARGFFLGIESHFPIHFAPHHLNPHGQASMMAPVTETEIGAPEFTEPIDKKGRYPVLTKHDGGRVSRLTLNHHPFDLAGWEGALYPFTFHIDDHRGIAREIHSAPPVLQTFQSGEAPHSGFAICTFKPQMDGWHPRDVAAPYAHYNVDSDEAMFFADANYGARKGVIEAGSLTFHPGSLPHSPQGNAALKSLANRGKLNNRLAVMIDTFFEPLQATRDAVSIRDRDYPMSWAKLEETGAAAPSA